MKAGYNKYMMRGKRRSLFIFVAFFLLLSVCFSVPGSDGLNFCYGPEGQFTIDFTGSTIFHHETRCSIRPSDETGAQYAPCVDIPSLSSAFLVSVTSLKFLAAVNPLADTVLTGRTFDDAKSSRHRFISFHSSILPDPQLISYKTVSLLI
jgi:hypothetical protein